MKRLMNLITRLSGSLFSSVPDRLKGDARKRSTPALRIRGRADG